MPEQDTQNTFNNQGQNTDDSQNTNIGDSPINNEVPKKKREKSFGPIIGILIIVVLLVFGGMYFYGSHLQQETGADILMVNDSFSEDFLNETSNTQTDRRSFEPLETPTVDQNYTEIEISNTGL